jgi:hypothetical protein
MTALVLGSLLLFGGIIALVVRAASRSAATRATLASAGLVSILLGVMAFVIASAVYVASDQTGVVVRTLGAELPAGHIVAVAGEKGPQAKVLGPGWHFGYWPWSYEVEKVGTIMVPNGQIGVVTALDGRVLPGGTVFAPAWKSADDMLDATKFLADGAGFRGPQLTHPHAGNYRINPRLFKVEMRPVTLVAARRSWRGQGQRRRHLYGRGEDHRQRRRYRAAGLSRDLAAAVVARRLQPPPRGLPGHQGEDDPARVHLSACGQTPHERRGAAQPTVDYSISVRSKDGFTFPVDVRLSLSVAAENAPYLVALLGDPDRVVKDTQEDDELEILEARLVLPTARAALRNVAETLGALEYVASRSRVETMTSKLVELEFKPYKLTFLGAFIGAIGLDATEAGQKLLLTQTDKEVASNQRATYQQQQQAEVAPSSSSVRARRPNNRSSSSRRSSP